MTNPNIFHHAFVVFCWCSIGTMLAGRNLLWERSVSGAEEQQYFAGSGCVVSGPVCGGLLRSLGLWPGLVFWASLLCPQLSAQRELPAKAETWYWLSPGISATWAPADTGSAIPGSRRIFPKPLATPAQAQGLGGPHEGPCLVRRHSGFGQHWCWVCREFPKFGGQKSWRQRCCNSRTRRSAGLYDWPVVQGKEEFNQSETERVGERLTTVQGPLENSTFPPSYFPEMRNESKSSLIDADSDVTPPVITTLNTKVIVTDSCILFSDIVKTLKTLGVSRDALNWAKVYHSFHKNVKQHNCFQYYCNNKKCFLSTKSTY